MAASRSDFFSPLSWHRVLWATHQPDRYHDDLVQRLTASGRALSVIRKAGLDDFDLVLGHLDCAVGEEPG